MLRRITFMLLGVQRSSIRPRYFKVEICLSVRCISLKLGDLIFLVRAYRMWEQMSQQILSTAPGLLLRSPHTWCFGQIPLQMKSGQDFLPH